MSYPPVRLSKQALATICQAFRVHFLAADHLWLFGSRVRQEGLGGDIDLYIETQEPDTKVALDRKLAFVNQLWQELGMQKIDVVLNVLSNEQVLPIYQVAKQEGVKLI